MKILRVITSTNPEDGGPVDGIREISRVLSKQGHETEIACVDSPKAPWIKDYKLKIHALGPGLTHYQFSRRLVRWLKKNAKNYDIVIAHALWQHSSYAVWEALRKSGTPYFVYPHGMLDPWFNKRYPLKAKLKQFYWFFDQHKVLRDAKAVIFTSEEEKRLARQSFLPYKCNEVVLPYGVALPKEIRKNLFFYKHPELSKKKYLLFLGRIHEKKGIDLLIQALAKTEDIHLVVAGPDQTGLQKKLARLAEYVKATERITWAGMLTGDLKFSALCNADALILPSHQENFGISVAEALACGTPVLITNKVNIWREIDKGNAGYVENDDLNGIVSLLKKWKSASSNQKRKMRQNARKCFSRNFEVTRAAKSLIMEISKHIKQNVKQTR